MSYVQTESFFSNVRRFYVLFVLDFSILFVILVLVYTVSKNLIVCPWILLILTI